MTKALDAGDNHAPRECRHRAVELLIYKISEAAEGEADRRGNDDDIREAPEGDFLMPAEEEERKSGAKETAMG